MNPQAIVIAITAALGMGAGWHIQTLRYTAQEHERDQQKLAQVQQSAAASIRRMDNTITAQNAATTRSVGLRRDRDSAYAELDRLRNAVARTMPGAGSAPGACVERANTVDQLLATCATELVEMGGIADRHASDALMLQQAWPK